MIQTKEVEVVVRGGQFAVGEIKVRVPRHSLLEQLNGLAHFFVDLGIKRNGGKERFRPYVEAVGGNIPGRPLGDRDLFLCGNVGLEPGEDLLDDLALDGKDVAHVALVSFGP